jgi:chemotaxis protein MotB
MTGKVLLARQPDWRTRTRATAVATSLPASKRRESVEFDETDSDHAGGDGGWTVGYLDVLLLLVTLFAALLGATYLQLNQMRTAHAAELEALESIMAPAEMSPVTAASQEIAATEADSIPNPAPKTEPQDESAVPPATVEPSLVAMADASASQATSEQAIHSQEQAPELESPATTDPTVAAAVSDTEGEHAIPPEFQALMDLVAAHAERQDLDLLLDRHQLRLEVGDGILFASGTAELGPGGQALIEELVTALDDERVKISVEGHTDDMPIKTPQFPSNWELSSIRATTVARELIAHGIPQQRIRVTGYADTRPRAPNDSAANRALNRRVSFVLEVNDNVVSLLN